ncbi:MAG: lipid-A-disaccharide synthase [Candidatus Omnitrophica bacterium]|nr:lipid-A-disaccharide synthase [Candidatus Omnitrophota bacterium]
MKHIMIIAGEASGDRHGANLINSLKTKDPNIRFTGLGGPLMHGVGQEQLYDIKGLAVMGLTEVLKKIFFFRRVFNETLTFLKRERPDALVLIDYPGFNVRFAEKAHKENIKVIYYISPQVWAWGKDRVKKIGRVIEKMLVVFPFEKDIYAREKIPVSFVGHPLLDELKGCAREDARRDFSLNPEDIVISILPGSRLQEIKLILPVMLKTAAHLKEKFNAHFLLPIASTVKREAVLKEIHQHAKKFNACVKVVEGQSAKVISASDLVITASGTATLETAILNRPMVIVYKVPVLSYLVLRRLIKLPCIGMVNILLKEEAFPEFIQYKARPYDIFKTCSRILEDRNYREKMIGNLKKLHSLLGEQGAGLRAAQEIWGIAYG